MSFLYAKSAEEAAVHHAKVAEQRRMLQEQMTAKAAGSSPGLGNVATAAHGRRAQHSQAGSSQTSEINMDYGYMSGFGAPQTAARPRGDRSSAAAFGRRADAQPVPSTNHAAPKQGIYSHLDVEHTEVSGSTSLSATPSR